MFMLADDHRVVHTPVSLSVLSWQQANSLLLFAQAMVHYNRIELLNHPVCKKYLAMKWCDFVISFQRGAFFIQIHHDC